MRYVDEFNDPELARRLVDEITRVTTRPWSIMEVCGGQTHAIIRHGIDQLLPDHVDLIHGPGCPVCVTPLGMIDAALTLAARPEVVFCSFGDMLRVPGSGRDLFDVKSRGGDVRIVYSPLDALRIAEQHPDREVVFFAIGFETTAPATAMAVHLAAQRGLSNFSMLVSQVLVPPAISAIAGSAASRVDGFLAAGHVCAVMGAAPYRPLVERFGVPIVVTGFEPLDVLEGIRRVILQLEAGEARLENAYRRVVGDEGNQPAQEMIAEVFEECDREWRGIGTIPRSGWRLTERYRRFDAEVRFGLDATGAAAADPAADGDDCVETSACRAGEVLQGLIEPTDCAAFGTNCTPRTPLGAPMVSGEGACAAYFRYRGLDPVAVRRGVR